MTSSPQKKTVTLIPGDGSAPDIAGKNLVNPVAIILSGVLMLEHLGENEAASRIRAAVSRVMEEGNSFTVDLGGTTTTTELTDRIIEHL
jgi:isocitrate dehydrogenase (NAD+)